MDEILNSSIAAASSYTGIGTQIITASGQTGYINSSVGSITTTLAKDVDSILDKWEMNHVTVDYKLTGQEFSKVKDSAPDYATEIKENLTKEATRAVASKMSFTKKIDKEQDVHHFIGRVWVFTHEELIKLLKE